MMMMMTMTMIIINKSNNKHTENGLLVFDSLVTSYLLINHKINVIVICYS